MDNTYNFGETQNLRVYSCHLQVHDCIQSWYRVFVHTSCVSAESLAYLTAATHDLTEAAQSIAETLQPTLEKVGIVYWVGLHVHTWYSDVIDLGYGGYLTLGAHAQRGCS